MSASMSLREQNRNHEGSVKSLNFKQALCQECRARRSIGQFTHSSEICDRCFKRKPKAG